MPKEVRRGKFDSRSKRCLMLGYCFNEYRLWDLVENKLITGRDVFDEQKTAKTLIKGQDFYQETNSEDNIEEDTQEELNEEREEITEEDCEELENNDTGTIHLETKHNMEDTNLEDPGTSKENQSHTALKNKNESLKIDQNEELGREKSTKWTPKRLEDFVTNLWPSWNNEEEDYMVYALSAKEFVDDVPQSYEEIEEREDKEVWKQAVREEMTSLIENKTWTLTSLPTGKKSISSKWVFKIKKDEDGNPSRFKARLVIKDCA